jgi:hypothetical protein
MPAAAFLAVEDKATDAICQCENLGCAQTVMKERSDAFGKYLRVDGHEYLFDVVTDGRERANLAKRHPDRLAAMRDQWQDWEKTMLAIPQDAQVYLLWDERDMPRATH